jgi:hypothetical protein
MLSKDYMQRLLLGFVTVAVGFLMFTIADDKIMYYFTAIILNQ